MTPDISRREFFGAATAGLGSVAMGNDFGFSGVTSKTLKILIPGLEAETLGKIRSINRHIDIIQPATDAARKAALPEIDVLFGGFTKDELASAKNLKWIQYSAAGVESLLIPELVQSNITLTNAKGCYAPEIAEHAFGLLFSLTRNIGAHIRMMKDHNWKQLDRPVELQGMTMGIVGLGGIGRETARRAKVMGMNVIAVDIEPIYPEQVPMVDSIDLVQTGLSHLLKNSDVVVSCAPHTKVSQGMFGAAEFAQMKKGSYFINVSRGKLVKTAELMDSCRAGKFAGVGLDVTDPEPLPKNHPLWDLPNVVITPHIAGQSQFAVKRTTGVFVENVRRFANGLPLLNVVDKVKGY